MQGGSHLAITVGALLPHNCDLGRSATSGPKPARGFWREAESPCGGMPAGKPHLLLRNTRRVALQLLELEGGGLPNVA